MIQVRPWALHASGSPAGHRDPPAGHSWATHGPHRAPPDTCSRRRPPNGRTSSSTPRPSRRFGAATLGEFSDEEFQAKLEKDTADKLRAEHRGAAAQGPHLARAIMALTMD